MAQRVAILSLALLDLERRNASLVRLLRKHQVAVPLELVADNNRGKLPLLSFEWVVSFRFFRQDEGK